MSDTKTGHIQKKTRNKANTQWRIQINGSWYGVDRGANVDGCDQGTFVEYQLGGFHSRDSGQWVPTIARIRPAQAPQGSTPPASSGSGANGASRLASAAWDDSALRFISNVVGCAVTAGHAKDPTDVLAWAAAAEQALRNLGQAQTPAGLGVSAGSAPKDPPRREPGQDDEPPFFDDSDDLMPRGGDKVPNW